MIGSRDPLYDALFDLEASAPFEPPPPLRQSRRGFWVAASGIALAAVLAGVAIGSGWLDRQNTGQTSPTPSPMPSATAAPSPSETSSPSATPTAESSPTPATTGFDVAWTEFAWPEDRAVNDVIYDEDRELWIAASGETIWTSSDATTWTEASVESAGCETPEEFCGWGISGVERLGDRLVAVGLKRFSGSDASALVSWVSIDASTWTLAANDVGTTAQSPVSVSSGGTVLVVTPVRTGDMSTLYNTSADGTTWESSREDGFQIFGVYGDADGFVGVGGFIEDGAELPEGIQPVVRVSADGHEWTTETIGEANGDALSSIARLPSGRYVAAGIAANGQVVVWASNGPDEPWTVTHLGEENRVEGSPSAQLIVAGGEDGVILASNTGGELFVATTVDGQNWRESDAPADPPDLLFAAMDVAGDTAVAFGGPRDPDNGFSAGTPFSGWVGTITPRTD